MSEIDRVTLLPPDDIQAIAEISSLDGCWSAFHDTWTILPEAPLSVNEISTLGARIVELFKSNDAEDGKEAFGTLIKSRTMFGVALDAIDNGDFVTGRSVYTYLLSQQGRHNAVSADLIWQYLTEKETLLQAE